MSETDPPSSLTIRDAADEAGRTPETIRRWVWSGRLPAHKQGNRLLVSRDDLDRITSTSPAYTLAAWRELLVAAKARERTGAKRSAADLVLADRRHRSSG
jgi:excisionase family DNA binding protein